MGTLWPLLRGWLAMLRQPRSASPAKGLAAEKRRLERLLREAGVSRTQAHRIAAEFFNTRGADAGLQ